MKAHSHTRVSGDKSTHPHSLAAVQFHDINAIVAMGEIFQSPIPCDLSKIPQNLSLPDYIFKQLDKILPQVKDKPWLVSFINS
jgi:hypothetical protein